MRVGIIGCGLIGAKRAAALGAQQLVAVADPRIERAQALAARYPPAQATADWQEVIDRSDVDLVIVATSNDWLAAVASAAARVGKHVLVEKPGGRSVAEIDSVRVEAERAGVQVAVGFNHRHHPALAKAKQIVEAGGVGPLLFIRGRYGHGGRPGYEREWRLQRAISGGGELLDQGVHLIDLSRWFLGDFADVQGHTASYFWAADVEDNCFLSLRTAQGRTAWLQASWTEWRNLFSFEVFGRDGKLQIDGLGGSYGVERLAYYRMRAEMGPPETTIWEYPGEDRSFAAEVAAFVEAIRAGRAPAAGLLDARAALEVVERVYAAQSGSRASQP